MQNDSKLCHRQSILLCILSVAVSSVIHRCWFTTFWHTILRPANSYPLCSTVRDRRLTCFKSETSRFANCNVLLHNSRFSHSEVLSGWVQRVCIVRFSGTSVLCFKLNRHPFIFLHRQKNVNILLTWGSGTALHLNHNVETSPKQNNNWQSVMGRVCSSANSHFLSILCVFVFCIFARLFLLCFGWAHFLSPPLLHFCI